MDEQQPEKTPLSERLRLYAYLLVGFLIGAVAASERYNPWLILRGLLFVGLFLGFVEFIRWFEHSRADVYTRQWGEIRKRGQRRFILGGYVLSRGLVLVVIFFVPAFIRVGVGSPAALLLSVFAMGVLGLAALLGHFVWKQCERRYEITLLRKTAEAWRILSQ